MLDDLVKNSGYLHPNRISFYGLGLTLAAVAASGFEETRFAAPVIYAFGAGCDYADGKVSRMYGLRTKEGAVLDPLIDKLKNFAVGMLMIYNEGVKNPILAVANLTNFAVDYVSQRNRGKISKQIAESFRGVRNPEKCAFDDEVNSKLRANFFGKSKTFIQNASHLAYLSYLAYHENINQLFNGEIDDNYLGVISGALIVGAFLGAVGVCKRGKKTI